MTSIRKILAQQGLRPRKRLGQSFLEDANIMARIVDLVAPTQEDIIVEIGAGLGVLTSELAKKAGRLIALEIDPHLVSILKERFIGHDRVEIVEGDVLAYDFSTACKGRRTKVVGNIPYYISTPILFRLIEYRKWIESMVLMFQEELANRIIADPGTKDYGILSVMVSLYTKPRLEMKVPPTCFFPKPKVASSVLGFAVLEKDMMPDEDRFFVKTVRSAFSHRRKTLWNNLRSSGIACDAIDLVLKKLHIDRRSRAETLTVEEFRQLAKELAAFEDERKKHTKSS